MESTQTAAEKEAQRRSDAGAPPDPIPNGGLSTTNNQVAVVEGTDFGDEAGAGMEGTRLEEQTTPFLRMAQGQSPELKPSDGGYIRDLRLGDVFNTATREVYDGPTGIEGIICWKDYGYGQWIPRDLGGGFRGSISPEDPLVTQTLSRMAAKYGSSARFKMPRFKEGRWSDDPARTKDTNEPIELVETGQFYLLYGPRPLSSANYKRAIIAFTVTALPAYNSVVTRHLNQEWPQPNGTRRAAPIYAYKWWFSTFLDKRGANEFYNWRAELAKPNDFIGSLYAREDPQLAHAAREFFELARSGKVQVADPSAGADPTTASGPVGSDDVPF
jgi:hypothetical protein